MANRLYTFPLSPPGAAARLALEHKGIDFKLTLVPAGAHLYLIPLAGFSGNTVPALILDGRRIQHSVEIARVLDELYPDPPLYPAEPADRSRVEEAEEWGEAMLQPVVRHLLRWGMANLPGQLMPLFVREVQRLRPVAPLALIERPLIKRAACRTGGTEENVRRHLDELGARLDRVDQLIAGGVIGGDAINAADLQIGTSVRVMLLLDDLKPLLAGRAAADHAMRIWPEVCPEIPAFLPHEWMPQPVPA